MNRTMNRLASLVIAVLLIAAPASAHAWESTPGHRAKCVTTAEMREITGLSKADAKKLLDSVVEAITDAAARGEEVALNGFGKVKV